MNSSIRPTSENPPDIVIDGGLYDRLLQLASNGLARAPEAANLLMQEIERADLRAPEQIPPNVVTIGSRVTFEDKKSGVVRSVELVFPEDADIQEGRISVLTPIGAALIGLTEGQSLHWTGRSGTPREVQVIGVHAGQASHPA